MSALRTGDHILRWITPARERRSSHTLRAECSCGARWLGVPNEETMRATHEDHIQQQQGGVDAPTQE